MSLRIITVNYPFEVKSNSEIGHTTHNGATRQIPGSASWDARNGHPFPSLEEEPFEWKMSTTAPCPAGAAMIRDDRAWHGTYQIECMQSGMEHQPTMHD